VEVAMKNLFFVLAVTAATMLPIAGCGNLSPRVNPKLQQQIDNQNGKIGEIESIQNGIKNDMLNMKEANNLQNSKLDKVQSGLANVQNTNEFHGLTLFSGNGGLVTGIFGMAVLALIMFHYRGQAKAHEKTADLLAERIVNQKDPSLEDNVFKAAMYSEVEDKVYSLIKKHQVKRPD
jgi:TolA-binding protein